MPSVFGEAGCKFEKMDIHFGLKLVYMMIM